MLIRAAACLLAWALGLGSSAAALAERVTLKMPNKQTASADYRRGQAGKPAVLILHGFLQTHEFPTVQRLATGLADEGYTVLAPTLTLGIAYRGKSLACEAIHNHTLADDFNEIDTWLNWLKDKGHASVALVGHSNGSTELLLYVNRRQPAQVRQLIGVSLIEVNSSHDPAVNLGIVKAMRERVAKNDRRLVDHPLSFCRKFPATPESLLSYVEWTPARILAEAKKARTPMTLIMGSADDRLGPDWIDLLRKSKLDVVVIEGANHFIDGEYEFDLLDLVLAKLKSR